MSNNVFKGKVIAIQNQREGISEKTGEMWKSLDLVVQETEGKYPQQAVFSMIKSGDKVSVIDNVLKYNKPGSIVEVKYNFKANKYKDQYYNKLDAWAVIGEKTQNQTAINTAVPEQYEDDLPF